MDFRDSVPLYKKNAQPDPETALNPWQAGLGSKSLCRNPAFDDIDLERFVIDLNLNGRQTFVLALLNIHRSLDALMRMEILPSEELRRYIYALVHAKLVIETDSPARGVLPLEIRQAKIQAKDAHQKRQELVSNISPFDMVDDPDRLKAQIRLMYTNLKVKNYYELLSVPVDAEAHHIEHQYNNLLRVYHPDRVGVILKDAAEQDKFLKAGTAIFKRLTLIFDTLSREQERQSYNLSLTQSALPDFMAKANADNDHIDITENDPQKLMATAHALLEEKNYKAAEQYAARASTLSGRSLQAELLRSWVNYKNENIPKKERVKRAKQELRSLFAQTRDPQVTYQLALMAEQDLNQEEAIRFAKMSLSVSPDHVQSRELLERLGQAPKLPPELSNKPSTEQDDDSFTTSATGVFKVLMEHANKEITLKSILPSSTKKE